MVGRPSSDSPVSSFKTPATIGGLRGFGVRPPLGVAGHLCRRLPLRAQHRDGDHDRADHQRRTDEEGDVVSARQRGGGSGS
ncbi:MAG: hypothetical protein H0T69_17445 [Thermoleophilaceae bacterium]|nr:hypothetical protein [Thermoleophilaceae bacterium]